MFTRPRLYAPLKIIYREVSLDPAAPKHSTDLESKKLAKVGAGKERREVHPDLNLIALPEGSEIGTHMSQTRISEGGPTKLPAKPIKSKTSRKRSA